MAKLSTIEDCMDYDKIEDAPIDIYYKILLPRELKNGKKLYLAHIVIFDKLRLKHLKYTLGSMNLVAEILTKKFKEDPSKVTLHFIYECHDNRFLVDASLYQKTIDTENEIKDTNSVEIGACALLIPETSYRFRESLQKLNSTINLDQRLNTLMVDSLEEGIEAFEKMYV